MPYNALRIGRHSEVGREYLITTVTHERHPYFANYDVALSVARCLHRRTLTAQIKPLCWVLMPDHLHLLLRIESGQRLSAVVKGFKGESAQEINRALDRRGPIWQRGFHDRALRRDDDRLAIARYIVANPLRVGLVDRVGAYPWWDSCWL